MKLFVGICLISCLIQVSIQQYAFNSHRWGWENQRGRSVATDNDDWSESLNADDPASSPLNMPGPKDEFVNPANLPAPVQRQNKQQIIARTPLVKAKSSVPTDNDDWSESWMLAGDRTSSTLNMPGPKDESVDPVNVPVPVQREKKQQIKARPSLVKIERNAAKTPAQLTRKPLSVKFVVKNGCGNVEKVEKVCIPAGKRIPEKLQRVLDSTDGYITVVYRDHKGLLTRIEKIKLPAHLPEETIPAGGLVINRSELPWEPSINPVEVEAEDIVCTKASNNECQNIGARPCSSPARVAQEVSSSPSQVQQSDRVYSFRKPPVEVEAEDADNTKVVSNIHQNIDARPRFSPARTAPQVSSGPSQVQKSGRKYTGGKPQKWYY